MTAGGETERLNRLQILQANDVFEIHGLQNKMQIIDFYFYRAVYFVSHRRLV